MKKIAFLFNRKNWSIPYLVFLGIFVVLPLLLILFYAFQDDSGGFSLGNFIKFAQQPEAINTFIYSIWIALITTVICILLGYPAAYILSSKEYSMPKVLILLFLLPMWINILLRTLATVALFDFLRIPLSEGALVFGMVYNFIPFMIYPIYNTMLKIDHRLIEAAQDLGATNRTVFFKVFLPLSMPGVVSGILMVFMPTISTFAISEILTMNSIRLFGTTIQENMNNGLWNYGSALSVIMLLIISVSMLLQGSGNGRTTNDGGLI